MATRLQLLAILAEGRQPEVADIVLENCDLCKVADIILGACDLCSAPQPRPSHDGSPACESGSIASGGSKAHCSCGVCF